MKPAGVYGPGWTGSRADADDRRPGFRPGLGAGHEAPRPVRAGGREAVRSRPIEQTVVYCNETMPFPSVAAGRCRVWHTRTM